MSKRFVRRAFGLASGQDFKVVFAREVEQEFEYAWIFGFQASLNHHAANASACHRTKLQGVVQPVVMADMGENTCQAIRPVTGAKCSPLAGNAADHHFSIGRFGHGKHAIERVEKV